MVICHFLEQYQICHWKIQIKIRYKHHRVSWGLNNFIYWLNFQQLTRLYAYFSLIENCPFFDELYVLWKKIFESASEYLYFHLANRTPKRIIKRLGFHLVFPQLLLDLLVAIFVLIFRALILDITLQEESTIVRTLESEIDVFNVHLDGELWRIRLLDSINPFLKLKPLQKNQKSGIRSKNPGCIKS